MMTSNAGDVYVQFPITEVHYSTVAPSEAEAAVYRDSGSCWNLTVGQTTANFSAEFDRPYTVSDSVINLLL